MVAAFELLSCSLRRLNLVSRLRHTVVGLLQSLAAFHLDTLRSHSKSLYFLLGRLAQVIALPHPTEESVAEVRDRNLKRWEMEMREFEDLDSDEEDVLSETYY